MPNELSRRQFLETLAAAAGASLLAGCGAQNGKPGAAGDGLHPVAAIADSSGTFTVPGAGGLTAGQALAFTFPNNEPGIVFVTSAGKPGALSAKCTHAGCTVEWRPKAGADTLHCPCHDSEFEPNGAVREGPAKKPLTHYSARFAGNDAVLSRA